MKKRIYIRTNDFRQELIRIEKANPGQLKYCDRVILDSNGEFVREIAASELRQLDCDLLFADKIPKGAMTIGTVIKISAVERRKREIRSLFKKRD